MNVRDLVPWTQKPERTPAVGASTGFEPSIFTLHRDMNRLFDDVFSGFGSYGPWAGRASWPQIEVEETDGEYRIHAELAGLDEKDVEVLAQDGVLIIRGEKRAETEDRRRAFSERVYGRFERRLALADVDENQIQASFRKGVLTIAVPKSANRQAPARRIPINSPASQ